MVFAPKYRGKVMHKELRGDSIKIFKKLCREMKVQIIEGEIRPDPIHLLVCIPRSMSAAQFTGTRKGKSVLMIFDRRVNLR